MWAFGADEEAGGVLATGLDLSDLVEEDLQVDDDAVADDGRDPGVSTPAGRRWKANFSPSMTTVCPALLPPLNFTT